MSEIDPQMEALRQWGERTAAIAERLVKEQPSLNPITAHIIAGDLLSAERATNEVNAGVPAEQAMWMVGSFARWDWTLSMVTQGALDYATFVKVLPRLWSASDPDDTKTENLRVWQRAFAAHGGVIRDGRGLPKGNADGTLTIYRGGGPTGVEAGIAWTTDPKVARKFASGAGERMPRTDGVVVAGTVRPSHVLAFITGRGESEVIVDPRLVQNVHTVGGH